MDTEILYKGHNNTIDLILKADGSAVSTSGFTKITATFGSTAYSSTNHASGLILWNNDGYDEGEIRLNLGAQSITGGMYNVPIIIYDSTYTDGLVWGYVEIDVRDDVEGS